MYIKTKKTALSKKTILSGDSVGFIFIEQGNSFKNSGRWGTLQAGRINLGLNNKAFLSITL